ncbi:MAG: hypothetical protein II363_02815 [Clostridia bacterium]|nr:hypothetical protein [Clostridia bacterium]
MNKQQPMWLRWMLCVWPAVLAAALYYILPHCPSFTDYAISRGLFRVVAEQCENTDVLYGILHYEKGRAPNNCRRKEAQLC